MIDATIEHHPHPGVEDVKLIRVNGIQVGYCGSQPGRPISLTMRLTEADKAAVVNKVTADIGKPSSVTGGFKNLPFLNEGLKSGDTSGLQSGTTEEN